MARGRRNEPREWVWARSAGVLFDEPGSGNSNFVEDLLEPVRSRHGTAALRGATVMAVKGYLAPIVTGDSVEVRTRVAMGIRQYGDLDEADATAEGPFGNPEARWYGWFPFYLYFPSATPTPMPGGSPPTWSESSVWNVDLQSARKMSVLGETLAIYLQYQLPAGGTPTVYVNYDLSVGVKLP